MKKDAINEQRITEKWAALLMGFFTLSSAFTTLVLLWLNH
jgi:hypothetical protein